MHCPGCREERLTAASVCAVCGSQLVERTPEELEAERAHLRYVLEDAPHWGRSLQAEAARSFLLPLYQRRERLLNRAEQGLLDPAPVTGMAAVREALPDAVVDALPIASAQTHEAPGVTEFNAGSSWDGFPDPVASGTEGPQPEVSTFRDEEAPEAHAVPIGGEPVFDIPSTPSPEQEAVEAVSSWRSVWRPFLYESIGWFIGAFLVVAGSIYFVALGWSGMSSLGRGLTLFGLAAGYSTAFSVMGALLSRREGLAGAGRVVSLIGSAMAPFAPLALGSLVSASPAIFWALTLGWAALAMFLTRAPAQAYDPSTTRWLQAAMGAAVLSVGAGPLLAQWLGAGAVWSALWALAVMAGLLRSGALARSVEQALFALLAPAYLAAVALARLHQAIEQGGTVVSLATYAPFIAALLLLVVRGWPRGERALSTPVGVAVVAGQLVCVVAAGFGNAPAFFISSALLVWTSRWLAQQARGGARWLYVTYAAGYLAYQSVGQLVPGWLQQLLAQVRTLLGYPPDAMLPFNYAAVYAVPYVLGGALLALRLLRSRQVAKDPTSYAGAAHRSAAATSESTPSAAAEVLLRSTAAATLFFAVEAAWGTDLRPAVWSIPPLAALAVGLGLWLDRPYLSWAGWCASLIAPVAVASVFGSAPAGLCAGGFALGWALIASFVPGEERHRLAIGGGLQSILAATFAWQTLGDPSTALVSLLALLLAASAAWLSAMWTGSRWAEGWALTLSLSAAPFAALAWAPELAPVALAAAALLAALVPTRSAPWLAVLAALAAGGWSLHLLESGTLVGMVLLLGVATSTLAARKVSALAAAGALLWGLVLIPHELSRGADAAWPWLTPLQSALALAVTAAAASVVSSWRRHSVGTRAYALVAVVGLLLNSALFDLFTARHGPVLLVAAVGVALSSRALLGAVCLPLATLLALVHLGPDGHLGRLLLAALMTAPVLLNRWPLLRERLLGGRSASLAAAASAMVVLSTALFGQPGGALDLMALVAVTLLPWSWYWATGGRALAAVPVLLGAQAVVTLGAWALWPPVLATIGVTHWVSRSRDDEAHPLSPWIQVSLLLATLALALLRQLDVTQLERTLLPVAPAWVCLSALASAALLCAGSPLSQRLMLAGLALCFAPGARGPGSLLLASVGFAALHAGDPLRRWLRAPEEEAIPRHAGLVATALAMVAWLDVTLWPGWLLLPSLAFLLAALLLEDSRLITVSVVALGASVTMGRELLGLSPPQPLLLLATALLAGLAAAVWRIPGIRLRAEAVLFRLSPGIDRHVDRALWMGAALQLAGWVFGTLLGVWPHLGTPVEPWLALAAAAVLWVALTPWEWGLATALWAGAVAVALPAGVSGAVLGTSGLLLALLAWRRPGAPRAELWLHCGWPLALLAVLFSGGLKEPLFPVAVLLSLGTAWVVVARRARLEWLGWAATFLAAHLLVFHLGVVFSTGRGTEFILPFLAVAVAAVAAVAAFLRPAPVRRWTVLVGGALACLEVMAGLALIAGGGPREATAAAAAMVLLFGALGWMAKRDQDEAAAFLGQGALLLAYLAIRLHGLDGELDARDGLAALLAGALFSGLHVWVRRNAERLEVFRRPALLGAYAFPLLGLLAAPWEQPLLTAALLVGHAAHFMVLAGTGARRLGSLVAAAAFNLALYLVWIGTHAGQAEYYVIPFGLSLLVLSRVFRDELDLVWQARLRAVAITTIYSASGWRALLFTDAWALGLCALVCVIGVAAGIALRIRSFVYLGTGFLVTSVAANLVRTGLQQPQLGALFLSLLGVLVVGFMVLFTAQRAELMRRYERMRSLLSEWEG